LTGIIDRAAAEALKRIGTGIADWGIEGSRNNQTRESQIQKIRTYKKSGGTAAGSSAVAALKQALLNGRRSTGGTD